MKQYCIIFLCSLIISVVALGFGFSGNEGGMVEMSNPSISQTEEYLRIHIRADSNENEAQAVKYKVRDRVVEYLTPLVANYQNKEQSMQGLQRRLHEIAHLATAVLKAEGFSYTATAKLEEEVFPTRVYGEITLPAGKYSSLIIQLGSGEGDNWWCVVYPPLCFAATDADVVYKSKIMEIIEAWKNRREDT